MRQILLVVFLSIALIHSKVSYVRGTAGRSSLEMPPPLCLLLILMVTWRLLEKGGGGWKKSGNFELKLNLKLIKNY